MLLEIWQSDCPEGIPIAAVMDTQKDPEMFVDPTLLSQSRSTDCL